MSGSPFGILESQASEKASEAQLASADKAIAAELQMYNQGRADLGPWREAGAGAINALWGTQGTAATPAQTIQGAPIYGTTTTGGGGGGMVYNSYLDQWMPANAQGTTSSQQIIGYQPSTTIPASPGTPGTTGLIQAGPGEFKASEGYQWTLGQGLQAQQRQAAATGRMGSGAYLKDATKYAEGLASTEYDNFLNRYYKSLDPYFRMAGYGSNVAMSGANSASQTGNALANIYQNAGASSAAGILGQYGAYSNALTNAGNQVGNYLMQNKPSWAQNTGYQAGWGYSPAGQSYWGNTLAGSAAGADSMMWL